MKEKKIESNQFKCKGCGGNLIYSPDSKDLLCPKCSNHYKIEKTKTFVRHPLDKTKAIKDVEYKEFIAENKIFRCNNCGANVILNNYEITKDCPYCNTSLIADEKSLPGMKPDAIIPFEFNKEIASEKFVQGVKKRFLVPRKFKKKVPESDISAFYIPSFGYDAKTQSSYNGRLYETYTTTDSEGHTQTHTRHFNISGTYNQNFNNVMVESSSKMCQSDLNGFLPYKYNDLQDYNNCYILGYSAENYDKDAYESIPEYKDMVHFYIRNGILSQYHYSGVDYLNINTNYSDEQYFYCFLPVYRFEYKFKKKNYSTYMNGQTGQVDKNLPKSKLKIAMIVISILLAFLIPLILSLTLSN